MDIPTLFELRNLEKKNEDFSNILIKHLYSIFIAVWFNAYPTSRTVYSKLPWRRQTMLLSLFFFTLLVEVVFLNFSCTILHDVSLKKKIWENIEKILILCFSDVYKPVPDCGRDFL